VARRRPSRSRTARPSRYIARVSRKTGKEIPGPIDPDELLVHAWRDKHFLEVTAQFLASRAIQLTVREDRVRAGLKLLNTAAAKLAAAGRGRRREDEARGASADGRGHARFHLPVPRADASLGPAGAGARPGLAEGRAGHAARARAEPAAARPVDGGHGVWARRSWSRPRPDRRIEQAGRGGAARDRPRPQDERGREGPVARAAGRAPAEAAAYLGSPRAEVPLRGRRHREARPRARGGRDGAARDEPEPRDPLRGQRLVRRSLRGVLPRQRPGQPERPGLLAAASSGRRARGSSTTSRSRRPTSTAARRARSRRKGTSPSRGTSTTTSTS
jgi:hypothetical protein